MPDWTIDGGTFSNATFAAAKIKECSYTIQNGGRDSARFIIPVAALDIGSPPFDRADDVTISYNGTVEFRGYVDLCKPVATGADEHWEVTLTGAMMKLSRTDYLQAIAITGSTTGFTSRVNLGFNASGTRLNLADTISGVLSDTSSKHGLSTGSILSGVTTTAPQMQITDCSVLEAIERCTAWCPDAVLYFNHTTGTVNLVKPASLTSVSVASTGTSGGISVPHIEYDHKKRFPVAGVRIIWETTTTVDGVDETSLTADTAGTLTGMDVVSITIPLAGAEFITQHQQVITEDIPRGVGDFTDGEMQEFLGRHWPLEFASWAGLNGGTPGDPACLEVVSIEHVVDAARKTGLGTIPNFGEGEDEIDAYPRALVNSTCPVDVSGISAAPVALKIVLAPGAEFGLGGDVTLANLFRGETKTIELNLNVTGTDAVTKTYQKVIQTAGAEAPLAGLATAWLAALNSSAPAGRLTRIGTEAPLNVKPGNRLTLTGAFAGTDAIVQSLTVDVDRGRSTVVFGPQSQLSPPDYVELMRAGSRRSPVLRAGGANRTSAEPQGKDLNGATSPGFKNTAVDPGKTPPAYFCATLKGNRVVNIAYGQLRLNGFSNGINYCDSGIIQHNHLGLGNEITGTDFTIDTVPEGGKYIWIDIQRAVSSPTQDPIFVMLDPSGTESVHSTINGWKFDDATLEIGNSLPSGEIVPIARYTEEDGVPVLKQLHIGAWPVYDMVYSVAGFACD